MSFRPVTIPLGTGLRQDTSTFALDAEQNLKNAQNVVFTSAGGLRTRPTMLDRTAGEVQLEPGSALTPGLGSLGSYTPAGIHAAQEPGFFGQQSPLITYHGFAAVMKEAVWQRVGTPVFTRLRKSGALTTTRVTTARANPVPVSDRLVGTLTRQGTASGHPYINSRGQVTGLSTASTTTFDAQAAANSAAANDALFYTTGAGDVRMVVTNSRPSTSNVLLAAASARVAAVPGQLISAWYDSTNGQYIVGYVSSTAGRITLLCVSAAGTVTGSLNVNGLGTVVGCSVVGNNTANRITLAWIDSAAAAAVRMKTKVFTYTSVLFTDAALDLNFANPNTTLRDFGFQVGYLGANASLAYNTDTGSMVFLRRSMTAATSAGGYTLYGRTISTAFPSYSGILWEVLFAPTQVDQRVLMGVLRSTGAPGTNAVSSDDDPVLHSSQWIVLDVTDAVATAPVVTGRHVVAYSRAATIERTNPASIYVSTNVLQFGVQEGTLFDDLQGVVQCAARRIRLELAPAASTQAKGLQHFTTPGGHVYDGATLRTHGFVETYPHIQEDSGSTGVGTVPAGSHTYQVVWEMVNFRGQVVRSGASEPVSITAPGGTNIRIWASVPQLLDYPSGTYARVKLYATEVTPSAGAPLYYVTESVLTTLPVAGEVALLHTQPTDSSQEQLYTGGGVLDDEPVPAGDRGVALALDRVWVAEQDRVFASKLLNNTYATAFSTGPTHVLTLPASLGEIMGLAGTPDHLVVVCESGVAMVRGSGYDDLGTGGAGWVVDILRGPGSGVISPRSVAVTSEGVVFEDAAGGLFVTTVSSVEPISRPAVQVVVTGDISVLASRQEDFDGVTGKTNRAMVHGDFIAGTGLYLDLDNGQWATWSTLFLGGSQSAYHAGISGVLWVQQGFTILSFDGTTGLELGDPITMRITTGVIRPSGAVTGWGRLRKVQLHGRSPTNDTFLSMYTSYDEAMLPAGVLTDTWPANALITTWPRSGAPELWPETQRCTSVVVDLFWYSDGPVEVNALELWVSSGTSKAPSENRG